VRADYLLNGGVQMKKNKPREIGGNATKAGKHVKPMFHANMVTLSETTENGTPVISDEHVELTRDFINENKK
jgi:hypothetical protein